MMIDLGIARVLVTFSGPSNPWWLIFAIGIPLGLLMGWVITRNT
jgi:uncharacterized membrane protein HdeD (DUF308 family)